MPSQESRSAESQYLLIEPPNHLSLNLGEIWRHRELLYFLVWRDIKLRYKQTLLGSGWVILQPLLNMAIFSLIFGIFVKVPSDGVPYPLFAFIGMVPWGFFVSGFTSASNSLLANTNLIKRVYFPRIIIPIASIFSGVLDLLLTLIVMFVMLLAYRVPLTLNVLWLPLFILIAMSTAMGVGLWLSSLNVQFRDVRFVVPFLTQFWMYSTPIVWPASILPSEWRYLIGLNPMAGVVEGFRWALVGSDSASWMMFAVSAIVSTIIFFSGIVFFSYMEDRFADII